MKYFEVDKTNFPIIVMSLSTLEPTLKDIDDVLQFATDEVINAKEKVYFIIDISKLKYLKAEFRIRVGNHMKEHDDKLVANTFGRCFVNYSLITAIIIKCVMFVSGKNIPVYRNLQEAIDNAKKVIASARIMI
jgi:hypothetical protein